MGIIREFYYGNLEPQARSFCRNTDFDKALQQLSDNEALLNEHLQGEDKQLFTDYVQLQGEILCTCEENSFENGFRLAVQLLLDALYGKSEQFKNE